VEPLRSRDSARFDLFHPTHPFYQSGDLPLALSNEERKKLNVGAVGYLRDEIPTKTDINHFRHSYDEQQAFCPLCAAKGLVTLPPFAYSMGRPYAPSINGDSPIYVWLFGDNLFASLCWNLVLSQYRPKSASAKDSPSWRRDGVVKSKEIRSQVGFLESLTWLPRRQRLSPGPEGTCTFCGRVSGFLIREVIRDQGWKRDKDAAWWQDPFVAYVGSKEGAPRALRPREDRSLWRDYAILFLPSRESGSHMPARIAEQAAVLCELAGLKAPRTQCFAFRNDNAKVFEWRLETFPLASRLVSCPDLAFAIERSLEKSENVGKLLRTSLKKLYPRAGKGNTKAIEGQISESVETDWSGLGRAVSQARRGTERPVDRPGEG
jgi:CRISPR type I-E-associated protein CasA/Cse1